MDDQPEDAEEELRRLTWEVRISRDHLLKVTAGMPSFVQERAQATAGKLTAFYSHLRDLSAKLPAAKTGLAGLGESLPDLRLSIEGALRDLDLLIKDLHDMLGESNEGEMEIPKAN